MLEQALRANLMELKLVCQRQRCKLPRDDEWTFFDALLYMGHHQELKEFSGAYSNWEEDNEVGKCLRAEPSSGALAGVLSQAALGAPLCL
jgi:hypothetical protein